MRAAWPKNTKQGCLGGEPLPVSDALQQVSCDTPPGRLGSSAAYTDTPRFCAGQPGRQLWQPPYNRSQYERQYQRHSSR